MTAKQIIDILGLKPLQKEGGYFRETYRAKEKTAPAALPSIYCDSKILCTAIYYLLTPDTFSALHKLPRDEIFHFYLGDPVIMLQLRTDATSEVITLGQELDKGQHVQVIVPKGTWQGSFLKEGGRYALLGTTMAPGFDFSDYVEGSREELISQYPDKKELIKKLTSQQVSD
ncbi:cupin domain-containing protein [Candidatus Latescibacterota bacterium]